MKHFLLFLCLLNGCSGVTYLGKIGDTKYYSVHSTKVDGPNFNALVSDASGKVVVERTFGGAGPLSILAPSVIDGAAVVGAPELTRAKSISVNVK